MEIEFILVQKAKSKGGDKYLSVNDPNFSIYIPQSISRVDMFSGKVEDKPHEKLMLTIIPGRSGPVEARINGSMLRAPPDRPLTENTLN